MRRGIFQVDGFFTGTHETNKALGVSQAHLANRLAVKALGGHQNVAVGGRVKQVNGTDFGSHGFLHPRYNDIQRLLQIAGAVYLLY
jgi:hypothetical protein